MVSFGDIRLQKHKQEVYTSRNGKEPENGPGFNLLRIRIGLVIEHTFTDLHPSLSDSTPPITGPMQGPT